MDLATEHATRGRSLMVQEIVDVDLEAIRQFYADAMGDVTWPEQGHSNGAKT